MQNRVIPTSECAVKSASGKYIIATAHSQSPYVYFSLQKKRWCDRHTKRGGAEADRCVRICYDNHATASTLFIYIATYVYLWYRYSSAVKPLITRKISLK